jgi:hypothetical protein
MNKYTVTFQVETEEAMTNGQVISIEDLIEVAVLPTVKLGLVPLTFEVKKARK